MAKDPAVLFYTSDFISGTLLMSDEQRGKYIMLLCLQHQKGGLLTEEDMMKICKTYDKDIFSKFNKDEDGNYYNERMKHETEKRRNYSESRRNNRKSLKNQDNEKDMSNISKSYVKHMENENRNENINRNKDEDKKRRRTKKKETGKDVVKTLPAKAGHPPPPVTPAPPPKGDTCLTAGRQSEGDKGSLPEVRKKAMPERMAEVFQEEYRQARSGAVYFVEGKDRQALGQLILKYKQILPDADTEKAIQDFRQIFRAILTHVYGSEFLNTVTIWKINSNFNEYLQILKNGKQKRNGVSRGFDPGEVSDWLAEQRAKLGISGIGEGQGAGAFNGAISASE